MELDELQCQEQIRQELITAETTHQNLKKDYDKLQVEHQQVRYHLKSVLQSWCVKLIFLELETKRT